MVKSTKEKKKCTALECEKIVVARGLCMTHFKRLRRTGTTEKVQKPVRGPYVKKPKRPVRLCSIDGCNRTHKSNGYCNTHLYRWRRTGDPGPAEILPTGKHLNRGNRNKLSDAQIAEIRSLYVRGTSFKKSEFSTSGLGEKFGVSSSLISRIINNKI